MSRYPELDGWIDPDDGVYPKCCYLVLVFGGMCGCSFPWFLLPYVDLSMSLSREFPGREC